jgi:RNA polymerase sigma factor (sigma-70 family)
MQITGYYQPPQLPVLPIAGYFPDAEGVLDKETAKEPLNQVSAPPTLSREQFADAYEAGYPITLRFLKSRGASSDIAEEVGQDAWAKAWACLHQLRQPELIRPWVNSIAKRMLSNLMQIGQKHEQITEYSGSASASSAGMDASRLLARCSKEDKFLLQGTYFEGRSANELGAQLGMKPVTVRVRLFRVLRSLKSQAVQPVAG